MTLQNTLTKTHTIQSRGLQYLRSTQPILGEFPEDLRYRGYIIGRLALLSRQ